jgi:general stress protein 26
MADITDLKQELWQRIDDQSAGMLGLDGTPMHMRPMTPHSEKDRNTIWFLCAADNQLAQMDGGSGKAHFTLQSPDEHFYACLRGTLKVSHDQEKLNTLWSVYASAFFEGGPEESDAILLEMIPEEAEIWTIEAGGVQFAIEIARSAYGDKSEPDLGTHDIVALP